MLTPAFDITQDDVFIYIDIKTPFVKISDVEIFISQNEFKFYVRPYFLRLNLPGEIIEDGRESASYDVEKGLFTVKVPKLNPAEHFEGLDMITKLLQVSSKHRVNKPCIEIIDDELDAAEVDVKDDDDDEEIEWFWEQNIEDSPCEDMNLSMCGYGFNNTTTGVFTNRQEELHELADICDPENLSIKERRNMRLAAENSKFDPDHYLADLFDDSQITHLINFQPQWSKQSDLNHNSCSLFFTEEEKFKLKNFLNKDYLLDDSEEIRLLFGLVDVIFAFAYNYRTTEGENNIESAWTVNKLSSTLCWFEGFASVHDTLISSCRRSLCYPLYRHWQLTKAVVKDTQEIFLKGRLQLLRCLLEIHSIFCLSEPRYILNDLYITDYCVWIQKISNKKLKWISNMLMKVDISKCDVGFELEELEEAARLVQMEENVAEDGAINQVQEQMLKCSLNERSSETSDDESSSGSGEESSSETDSDVPD